MKFRELRVKSKELRGEPSDGTNFESTANPGIGSQFGQTKFLAIHSASLAKNKVVIEAVKHYLMANCNYK